MKLDNKQALARGERRPNRFSICPYGFLATPVASDNFLDTLLLTGFQVEGMTASFLEDVFLLYLALETAESVFEGYSLLKSHFSQTNCTPKLVPLGPE
jgi:hypothetical protein